MEDLDTDTVSRSGLMWTFRAMPRRYRDRPDGARETRNSSLPEKDSGLRILGHSHGKGRGFSCYREGKVERERQSGKKERQAGRHCTVRKYFRGGDWPKSREEKGLAQGIKASKMAG